MSEHKSRDKDESFDFVVKVFNEKSKENPNLAIAVVAIQALTVAVSRSKASTMMELEISLKAAADKLKATNKSSISLAAGCELFNRYVTRTSLEINDFNKCKSTLIERGKNFVQMSMIAREKITEFGDRFIQDGKVVFIHGRSQVVINVLLHAAQVGGKLFSVICTEGRPTDAGGQAAALLSAAGIPVTVVLDSAIGYIMEKADLCLVGAEGVVESGGIINQVGTYTMAMAAKSLNIPFYVAAESYKFARLYPLTQHDLPGAMRVQTIPRADSKEPWPEKVTFENPTSDYTPPDYITLLFTDLGILTPSAVSDELIKLYY